MRAVAAWLLAAAVSTATAAPFVQVNVPDDRTVSCDYENTTLSQAFSVPVEVDVARGRVEYGYRICKADTAVWPTSGDVSIRFRGVGSDGKKSTWTAATLPRAGPSNLHLAALVDTPPPQIMAAALRSIGTSLGYASHTNPAISAPAGIVDGDVLVLLFVIGNASPPSVTLPAGFTQISGSPSTFTGGGFSVKMYVATKVASGESGSYTVTHSASGSDGVILAVSGASGTVTPSSFRVANGSDGQSETAASVTSAGADALIVYLEHNWDLHGSTAVPTATDPTLTERLDSSANLIYVATGAKATAGATGTWSTSDNDNAGNGGGWQTVVLAVEASTSSTTRGMPLGDGGTAFNGGRTFRGIIGRPRRRDARFWYPMRSGVLVPRNELRT